MKHYLFLMLMTIGCLAQQTDSISADAIISTTHIQSNGFLREWIAESDVDSTSPQKNDSLLGICAERGHIKGFGTITAMATYDEYIDFKNKTVRVFHDPNWVEYHCRRCGTFRREAVQQHPDTVVVWRRKYED